MKTVNEKVLKQAADNLLFNMSEEEIKTLLKEFDVLLGQMALIGKIKGIDDNTPMTFPFEINYSSLREDEIEEPLSQEDALKNAGDVLNGQIKLPKVVK